MLHSHPAFPLGAALTLLAAGGCGSPTAPLGPDDPPVVMSDSLYVLEAGATGWRGELAFTYYNVTDRTLSLANCRGGFAYRLEKWTDEGWVTAWSPVLLMCLSPPIRIPPGRSHEHVATVFSGFPDSNSYPRFQVDEIDGTYRVVIDGVFWNYDHDGPPWGEVPPEERRVSHPFEIRTEE